ncbi:MAG: bifunctional diaminohydroxyphosphoribosylaminopyrimidine deaminase/5-amino-6-(5-phosphoribosylamino)uracil reductase RibD [Pseudomonadota bacterium]
MVETTGASTADGRWMRAALSLARRGLGRVAPNPSVAALLVRDGRVLGRGVTVPSGRPHAEAVALARARALGGEAAAQGATAYVTLEPCAHHGRTPPCADALIAAGVERLVCPITDPDPRVSGRGFARLAGAGVRVDTGLMALEARRVNGGFLSRHERGRPWVTLKLATTLDGRIATATGESRWITGPEARRRGHMMRAEADAVLIGAGTARADDPMLDVRDLGLAGASPIRVVADPRASLSPQSRLARTAHQIPVWLLQAEGAHSPQAAALAETEVRQLTVAGAEDGIDIAAGLAVLARSGITRVLCEGGGRLAASLLAADVVDELALFSAGHTIGADGHAAIGALGLDRLADAPGFHLQSVTRLGPDVLSLWSAESAERWLAGPVVAR